MIVEWFDGLTSILIALGSEGAMVLAGHLIVGACFSEKLWFLSDVSPSELDDLRERFRDAEPTSRPEVLTQSTLYRYLRVGILWVSLVAFASNYLRDHHSWGTALLFLTVVVGIVEVLYRLSRRKFRRDVEQRVQWKGTSLQNGD